MRLVGTDKRIVQLDPCPGYHPAAWRRCPPAALTCHVGTVVDGVDHLNGANRVLAFFPLLEGSCPSATTTPQLRTHEGDEWLYVLSGHMRLVLGDHDFVLRPGEVAEFDTHVPHWFGSDGVQPAEVLSLFGRPRRACPRTCTVSQQALLTGPHPRGIREAHSCIAGADVRSTSSSRPASLRVAPARCVDRLPGTPSRSMTRAV
jgi:mannose-6-phosphate isomerase-like protein (cupin superfamily)